MGKCIPTGNILACFNIFCTKKHVCSSKGKRFFIANESMSYIYNAVVQWNDTIIYT